MKALISTTTFVVLVCLFSCTKIDITPPSIQRATAGEAIPPTINSWVDVFNPAQVLELHLRITRSNWDIIRFDATNSIEVPVYFKEANDAEELLVSVRRKSSRALPSETDPWKIGMKIGIGKLVANQRWNSLNKLSLENGSDVGPIAEGVGWNLYELAANDGHFGELNFHPALAAWVKVYLHLEDEMYPETNETKFLGVYINVEQRDKQFMINRGWYVKGSSWLYEVDDIMMDVLEVGDPNSPTYNELGFLPFRLVTTTTGKKTVTAPIPADPALKALLDAKVDMQVMLAQGAIDAFSGNGDALFSHGKNFKFVDFGDGSRRVYLPWDLDAVFGKNNYGIYGTLDAKKLTQNNYQKIILNHYYYRQQYNQTMISLLNTSFSNANLNGYLDAWKAAVAPELALDPYESNVAHMDFDGLKRWFSNRQTEVRAQVQKNQPAPRAMY